VPIPHVSCPAMHPRSYLYARLPDGQTMIRCNSATSQLYSHQRRSPSLSSLLLTSLSNIPTRSNNQSNKKEYAIMTLQSHSPLLLPIFHFIQMETPYMKRPECRNVGMPLSIMKMPECRNATVQSHSKHPSSQNLLRPQKRAVTQF